LKDAERIVKLMATVFGRTRHSAEVARAVKELEDIQERYIKSKTLATGLQQLIRKDRDTNEEEEEDKEEGVPEQDEPYESVSAVR
jgi:hypothetical protein